MLPYLFHIYGPFYANCYGLAICLGILIFTYLVDHDPRRAKIISSTQLQNLILWGTVVGVVGGRILWAASNLPMSWYDLIEIWEGGLSVLGAVIAILLFATVYLKQKKIPVLPLLDLVAIYAPLLQAISRIGCLMAGCCYGWPTNLFWGVTYTHPDSAVPPALRNVSLHPTQLYSALILLVIFLLMHNLISKYFKKPGQLIAIYLMLSAFERFLVDFWRADQEIINLPILQNLGLQQLIALIIFSGALVLFVKQSKKSKPVF